MSYTITPSKYIKQGSNMKPESYYKVINDYRSTSIGHDNYVYIFSKKMVETQKHSDVFTIDETKLEFHLTIQKYGGMTRNY